MTRFTRVFKGQMIRINEGWLTDQVHQTQLLAQKAEIEKKDPQYFHDPAKFTAHLAELTAQAEKAFAATDEARQKKIAVECEREMEKLNNDLKKDSPTLRISAKYQYERGQRGNGSPGWNQSPAAAVKAGKPLSAVGAILLDEKIVLSAVGIPITIPVKILAKFSLSASYSADTAVVAQCSVPESAAGAVPILDVKTALEISSENRAVNVEGITGIGWVERLPPVNGTLKADPKALLPVAKTEVPKGATAH